MGNEHEAPITPKEALERLRTEINELAEVKKTGESHLFVEIEPSWKKVFKGKKNPFKIGDWRADFGSYDRAAENILEEVYDIKPRADGLLINPDGPLTARDIEVLHAIQDMYQNKEPNDDEFARMKYAPEFKVLEAHLEEGNHLKVVVEHMDHYIAIADPIGATRQIQKDINALNPDVWDLWGIGSNDPMIVRLLEEAGWEDLEDGIKIMPEDGEIDTKQMQDFIAFAQNIPSAKSIGVDSNDSEYTATVSQIKKLADKLDDISSSNPEASKTIRVAEQKNTPRIEAIQAAKPEQLSLGLREEKLKKLEAEFAYSKAKVAALQAESELIDIKIRENELKIRELELEQEIADLAPSSISKSFAAVAAPPIEIVEPKPPSPEELRDIIANGIVKQALETQGNCVLTTSSLATNVHIDYPDLQKIKALMREENPNLDDISRTDIDKYIAHSCDNKTLEQAIGTLNEKGLTITRIHLRDAGIDNLNALNNLDVSKLRNLNLEGTSLKEEDIENLFAQRGADLQNLKAIALSSSQGYLSDEIETIDQLTVITQTAHAGHHATQNIDQSQLAYTQYQNKIKTTVGETLNTLDKAYAALTDTISAYEGTAPDQLTTANLGRLGEHLENVKESANTAMQSFVEGDFEELGKAITQTGNSIKEAHYEFLGQQANQNLNRQAQKEVPWVNLGLPVLSKREAADQIVACYRR